MQHIHDCVYLLQFVSSSQLQYELLCFDEMVTEIFVLPPAHTDRDASMTRYTPASG